MSSEEAGLVMKKYASIYAGLEGFEANIFSSWSSTIVDESEANLNKPLLVRQNDLLQVNFDPKVVALLREVKYLGALNVTAPAAAAGIYSKSEIFRKYIFSLDHITRQYNNIRTGVLEVEKPLIESKIGEIDGQIEQALNGLTWKSEGVDLYIGVISATVGDLSSTLQVMKNNIGQTQKILKGWSSSPLIERKDPKKCLSLEEKESKVNLMFESIRKDGQLIHSLLKQTQELVNAEESSENWINYRDYVDSIVSKGYKLAIQTSLEYLVANMEQLKSGESNPLLESKLELENEQLQFTPCMDEDAPESLLSIVTEFLDDIYHMSSLMGRISVKQQTVQVNPSEDASSGDQVTTETVPNPNLAIVDTSTDTYLSEMLATDSLNDIRVLVLGRVHSIIEKSISYKEGYDQYSYLWTVLYLFFQL